MIVYSLANKIHLHETGFALSLVLKVRILPLKLTIVGFKCYSFRCQNLAKRKIGLILFFNTFPQFNFSVLSPEILETLRYTVSVYGYAG